MMGDVCVACGLCSVIPGSLPPQVLAMAHEGHLRILRVKQCCHNCVWWPGIIRDTEVLGKYCTARLLCDKTGPPKPVPMQPLQPAYP